MKICNTHVKPEKPYSHPPPVHGNIYCNKDRLYLAVKCAGGTRLFDLATGRIWSVDSAYGSTINKWEDVTNKYCLVREAD